MSIPLARPESHFIFFLIGCKRITSIHRINKGIKCKRRKNGANTVFLASSSICTFYNYRQIFIISKIQTASNFESMINRQTYIIM